MSHLLDRLNFFKSLRKDTFADGHGQTTLENRDWEDTYRNRWRHDKIVRSTHGVNCTGSCSWKIYVKSGIVTWETQQTDYPRTRPDLPNHEPRGCARGASYSWYLYSANRVKTPLVRGRLMKLWREKRKTLSPVKAWEAIQNDPAARASYTRKRGTGGFVRASWDEVTEITAAANAYTAKKYGPDRVFGFSPIPAMSMVSYAAGSRYLSLLGGTCMSFYDWYCDLPPSSPQTWGEQTDVPESADWYNAGYLLLWGSNVPQTRTPDAHFYTEARYRGTKSAVICPDYSEAAKFGDVWLNAKQGTDAALGMAFGHVILREFHLDRQVEYFEEYCRKYSDMPMLVKLEPQGEHLVPGRQLRAADFDDALGQAENPDWKTVGIDEASGTVVVPNGSIGFRWSEAAKTAGGRWNLEERADGQDIRLKMSLILEDDRDDVQGVAFPYFGGAASNGWQNDARGDVLVRNVPVKKLRLADGQEHYVATVFDLFCANYSLDRGLGGEHVASDYDADVPFTPAWAECITGVSRDKIIHVAREFAANAEKTGGKSMVIIGAAMNHWYHMDMNYRAVINMLVMCGCVGQSGGGWAHYVGQEKLRPQTGWTALAFALDWARPPRHMNSTSAWYAHTNQWRYETVSAREILSPTAPKGDWESLSLIDYNIRAERMGWLPSAPQLKTNPLEVGRAAKAAGKEIKDYVAEQLKSGALQMSCEDPDAPENWPRNLFVWRSNLLGSSGKGHEYFLKHLLGTDHGVLGKDLGEEGRQKPAEAVWHDKAPEGKLDLLVTLESDHWWQSRLDVLDERYPHAVKCPLDNLYGMHLYSRLPLEDAQVQFLVESDIPSIHALARLPSGRTLRLHCLHPAPPSPSENEESTERDAELVMVGKSAAAADEPVIVTGDLNDVAWSETTRLFRRISGLLDPRVGRGMFNSYHAGYPFLRWPLDHLFHSRDFRLVDIRRLPAFGSDHFPVLVTLVLTQAPEQKDEGLDADADDHAQATQKMKAGTVRAADVHAPGN